MEPVFRSQILLSHVLDASTPGFGGQVPFSRQQVNSIAAGKSSNSELWSLQNHSGSHVDTPRHFIADGKTLTDIPISNWLFQKPNLLDRVSQPDEVIEADTWCDSIPIDCDLVLLRTGFEERRHETAYWQNNPGLAPSIAHWLRRHRPSVRAIGFDFLSLTAFQHRELGRVSHKAFLAEEDGPEILIFEDLSLKMASNSLRMVLVAPLMVQNADGSPITVFGFH